MFREILTLNDGGEVALDWMEEDCPSDSPVILILPGLTGALTQNEKLKLIFTRYVIFIIIGESQAEYIKCLVFAAKSIGVRTVVFNNRGLGGLPLKVIA